MPDSGFTGMISPPLPRSEGVLGGRALGGGQAVGVEACGCGSVGVLGDRALGGGQAVGVEACGCGSVGVLGDRALGGGQAVGVEACGCGSVGVLGEGALGGGQAVGVGACDLAGGRGEDECRGGVLESIFGRRAVCVSQVASCRAGASWKHVFEVGGASQAVGGGGSARRRVAQGAGLARGAGLAWGDGGVYVACFVCFGFVWGVCRFLFLCFRADGTAAG